MSVYTSKWHSNSTNVRFKSLKHDAIHLVLATLEWFAPLFARRLVSRLFFTPARRRLSGMETLRLSEGTPFSIFVHGKTVSCWKWGRGPAVLLVHGWNGRGIHLHHFIRPLVRAGYAVIAFDAPGHGDSAGKTSNFFEFTDAVRAFVKRGSGYRVCAVIAHSLGAAAAVNALAKENPPVNAVLIAPALKLKEILYSTFDRYGIPADLYRQMIELMEQKYGYSLQRDNPFGLLAAVAHPVLIVHDRDDGMIPYADAAAAARNYAAISLKTTAGLGHKRILTDPSVVEAAVRYVFHRQPLSTQIPPAAGSCTGPAGKMRGEETMGNLDVIVEDYRHADDGERLNLFLQWPSLRRDFILIEQREKPPANRQSTGEPRRALPSIWKRCRGLVNII
jgi:pimeloyl-ACP methyl ester carboxylesterase